MKENDNIADIQWISVASSNIESVAHKATVLYVKFKNQRVYSYGNVPREIFQQLVQGASVGRTFHQLIKSKEEEYPAVRLA